MVTITYNLSIRLHIEKHNDSETKKIGIKNLFFLEFLEKQSWGMNVVRKLHAMSYRASSIRKRFKIGGFKTPIKVFLNQLFWHSSKLHINLSFFKFRQRISIAQENL